MAFTCTYHTGNALSKKDYQFFNLHKNGNYSLNIPIEVRCFILFCVVNYSFRTFPICLDSLLFVYCLQRGHHQPCKVSYPPKDLSLNIHGNACKICTLKPHDLTNVLLLLMGTVL